MDTLADSESRFRGLVEQSSDWIWEVDENGIYTYSSPSVLKILGYSPHEVVGRTPFDFMPIEEAARLSETFSVLVQSRKPIENLENANLRKDGSIVVLETSGVPVFDKQGKFRGYRGMDRDITARKAAEEGQRQIGARLEQAQRIAHLGSWDWDIRENRLSWSDEMYRIFGIDSDRFGASFEAFMQAVHPDDRKYVKEAVDAALLGQGYDIEYRVVKVDGEERIVHAQGEVAFDEDKKPSRMLGTVLDITERKKTENELRLFRTLLDNSNDAIEVLDSENFRFLDMNEKACRDLGYSKEEILGMPLQEIDPGFDRAAFGKIEASLEKTGAAVFESV
ncbi:MAG TPA: PAS domain S-box protein, partial [Burkholderiales bacterium]|nr:PAS domain S-box protein [Burkholderiales bacterium]